MMGDLPAEVEQQLAEMGDADWQALTARVRPPVARPGDAGRAEADRRFSKSNGAGDDHFRVAGHVLGEDKRVLPHRHRLP